VALAALTGTLSGWAAWGPAGSRDAGPDPVAVAVEAIEAPAGAGSMAPELVLVDTGAGPEVALTRLEPVEPAATAVATRSSPGSTPTRAVP